MNRKDLLQRPIYIKSAKIHQGGDGCQICSVWEGYIDDNHLLKWLVHISQSSLTRLKRDLHKLEETYKRDLQKRPVKETCKKDSYL